MKGMVTLAFRMFQELIVTVIYHIEILMKMENSSEFLQPYTQHLGFKHHPQLKRLLLRFHEYFSPSVNHKTVTQSAETHISVGEKRKSSMCSHHVSGSGHVPGQSDRISRAERDGVMFPCGRPPWETEW